MNKDITLEQFHSQYFKGKTKTEVAKILGISSSEYSKIKYGQISRNSEALTRAKEKIKWYGYNLLLPNPEEQYIIKLEKEIRDLKAKLQDANYEISRLKNEILWYNNTTAEFKKIYKVLEEKFKNA